jgi:hypothetical protein
MVGPGGCRLSGQSGGAQQHGQKDGDRLWLCHVGNTCQSTLGENTEINQIEMCWCRTSSTHRTGAHGAHPQGPNIRDMLLLDQEIAGGRTTGDEHTEVHQTVEMNHCRAKGCR